VILPVTHKAEERARVLEYCQALKRELSAQSYGGRPIEVEIDDRDLRGGDKIWQWIKKGVPLRLEIGPRDIQSDSVFLGRRDRGAKEKGPIKRADLVGGIQTLLQEIQDGLFARAAAFRTQHTQRIDSKDDFYAYFTPERVAENAPTPIHGGFALTHFSGDPAAEQTIKDELGVTVRCIPLSGEAETGTCPFSGRPSPRRVIWAKSY
jgi:prolyl-tRNA synthetase